MSWNAAPCTEVTTPTARGYAGSGRFRSGAKSPSAWSRARTFSNAIRQRPGPRASSSRTTSW